MRHEHNNVIGNSNVSNTNIACASFCMDATEVAEEKDPESERCISILKESNLLAFLSSENFAENVKKDLAKKYLL